MTREFRGMFREYWFEATDEDGETTGNCCENYITTTPDGRIYDFGGTYIQYSDDEGQTWSEPDVYSPPYLGGEGAITVAPNGDVVAIGWAPYSGDQVYAFKWTKATDTWEWAPVAIHTPAWDREWIVALEGPFTYAGETVDYITMARGGIGYKDVILLSTDGLNYHSVSLAEVEGTLLTSDMPDLTPAPSPMRDWTQPLQYTSVFSLGPSSAIHTLGDLYGCALAINEAVQWGCSETLEDTLPGGPVLMDSQGGLHIVNWNDDETHFTYHHSTDGGETWTASTHELPLAYTMVEWDFKAHAALDQTVIALRAAHEDGTGQDMLYRFRGLDDTPWLQEIILVGDGTADAGTGGASNTDGERYDFMSVAFLPDGRVVMSTMSNPDVTNPLVTIER